MNWDFLQGDFSAGEISTRSRGNVGSDIYKAAMSRARNTMPTRAGSVASRAGGRFVTAAPAIGSGGVAAPPTINQLVEARGRPVQHIPVLDGPYGDFIVEIGNFYIRMLDKFGVRTWHQPIDPVIADGLYTGFTDVWGDADSQTLYFNNSNGVGQRVLSIGGSNNFVGDPAGTDETFTLVGNLAGDSVTLRVINDITAGFADYVIPRGAFSINFGVIDAGNPGFSIYLRSQAGVVTASTLWGLKLTKNGMQTSNQCILTAGKVQSESFWANGQFWVVLVDGSTAMALCWTTPPGGADQMGVVWNYDVLPLETPIAWTINATIAKGDQRLAHGNVYEATIAGQTAAVGTGPTGTGAAIVDNTVTWAFVQAYDYAGGFAATTIVVYQNRLWFGTTDIFGGVRATKVGFGDVVAGSFKFQFGGVHLVPQAADALNLKLAAPTGKICWMRILHGMVIGTTRRELTFTQGATLAIDPSTGLNFDALDHSELGSDPALGAMAVNEKIMFFQKGRQILRSASVRFNWESGLPQGGLIAEDIGVYGEEFLQGRVRSMCYLKSPVPRLVFALDDGTVAVATLGGPGGVAWSGLSLPAVLGGVFSVVALNTTTGSQLWIGTESGTSLQFDILESDIVKKVLFALNGTAAPTRTPYATDTPLPPVMDGWTRLAAFTVGADVALSGSAGLGRNSFPVSLNGQSVYILSTGQVFGPYLVYTNGAGQYYAQNAAADVGWSGYNWVDAAGKSHAREMYVGLAYPEHKAVTLPMEGGNPVGTSQALKSRHAQLYVRLVDSYMPLINGVRPPERGPGDVPDLFGTRVTEDIRSTELGFQRGSMVTIEQDRPLRMEFSAIFGGTQTNNL